MRVLVTGGAGFIGSHVVQACLDKGHEVTILDDLSAGGKPHKWATFVKGEIFIERDVNDAVGSAGAIVHAACRPMTESLQWPYMDFAVNATGTLKVLLASRAAGIPVIYTSSSSVYGQARHLPSCEDDPTDPQTPYAVSKLAGENYCRVFARHWGTTAIALRLSNVYGPGGKGFINKLARSVSMEVHGDGEQTRDWVHVYDVVRAIMMVLEYPQGLAGEVINIGTGIETSVNALCALVSSRPIYVKSRDIDTVRRRCLNIEKAQRLIGWTPLIRLAEGIATCPKA